MRWLILFAYSMPYKWMPYKCMGLCITGVAQKLCNEFQPGKYQTNSGVRRATFEKLSTRLYIQHLKRKVLLIFRVHSQREFTLVRSQSIIIGHQSTIIIRQCVIGQLLLDFVYSIARKVHRIE